MEDRGSSGEIVAKDSIVFRECGRRFRRAL